MKVWQIVTVWNWKLKEDKYYWQKLLIKNQTVTNCDQLKLKAEDGKYRMTDVVYVQGDVLNNWANT